MKNLYLIFLLCSALATTAFAQSTGVGENQALGTLDDLIVEANRVVISDQPFELAPGFAIIGENRVPAYELSEIDRGKPSRYFYYIHDNKRLVSKIQILKKFPPSYYSENDEPN